MSYNVLIVPEDFTKDEHILLPLVRKILSDAGKPKATVLVCRDPNFQGVDGALDQSRIRDEVIRRYPMVNLFLLMVDRDGKTGRDVAVNNLQSAVKDALTSSQRFIALTARQEVEIFPIAGNDLSAGWSWPAIRQDSDVKNTYFKELARREGKHQFPHEGRKQLMTDAMRNWNRIKTRCPEETTGLVKTIQNLD